MAAVGELVRSTTGEWIARPPLRSVRKATSLEPDIAAIA